jgi:hypothetical protein
MWSLFFFLLVASPLLAYELAERRAYFLVVRASSYKENLERFTFNKWFAYLIPGNGNLMQYWVKHIGWIELMRYLITSNNKEYKSLYKKIKFLFYSRKILMAVFVLEIVFGNLYNIIWH